MRRSIPWALAVAAFLAALPARADDRARDRAPQSERDQTPPSDADRDDNGRHRPGNGPGAPQGQPPANRPPDNRPPERHNPNGQGYPYPNGQGYPYPNGQGYPYPQGNQYPTYSTNGSIVAQAVIEHPDPRRVRAWVGAVGDPFGAVAVRFTDNAYDIVRSRTDDQDNRGRWNQRTELGGFQVDLSRYNQYADGYREWYLRLEDTSGRGGQLRSFQIQTGAGVVQVRNVPAYFGPDRRLEARVTPRAGSGYGGGYNPYPGSTWPPTGGTWPTNQGVVTRRLLSSVTPDRRFTIEYQVALPLGTYGRIEITENLPSTGWRILRIDPQPRYYGQHQSQVVWDFAPAPTSQRLLLEVIAPRVEGWQRFWGTYRLDGGPATAIGGETSTWVGYGTQPGNGWPNTTSNNPVGWMIDQVFGWPSDRSD